MTGRAGASAPEAVSFSEEEGVLYLHLGHQPWVQSAMRIDDPHALELEYVRQMTLWLAFLHAPARLAVLGLGGGSLVRWSLKHLTRTRVDAVDHNPSVILAAQTMFGLPTKGRRLRLFPEDALAWVHQADAGAYGVVLVDLYDGAARGPVLDSVVFYSGAHRLLDPAGSILVVNLFGQASRLQPSLTRLRRAFDDRILLLPPTAAGNRVALAFVGPPLDLNHPALPARLDALQARFGFPYASWLSDALASGGLDREGP